MGYENVDLGEMEGIIPLHKVKLSCTESGREICATFFSYRPAH